MGKLFKIYNELSLKKKVVSLFLLTAIIPLLATTFVISYISGQALMSAVYQNKLGIAAGIAREVNETLGAKSNILMTAASSEEVLSGDPARQLAAFKNILKQNPGINALAITDSQGRETITTFGDLLDLKEREYFKKVKNGATVAFSDVYRPKGMEQAFVVASVPIKDSQNKFLGTVVGVIDLQVLSDQTNSNKIGNTGIVFIADRAGKILAHPDKLLLEKELIIPPVKAALEGQSGAVSYVYNGDEKLAGYSLIPLTGWAVVAQQSLGEATADVTKVKMIGTGFTLGAIVLAVLVGFFAAGALIRPIRELVAVTGQLAQGDLTVRATVAARDELGQLAESFNAMAGNLKELIRGVTGNADQVAAAAEELSATTSETEHAINQIASTMTDFAQGSQKQTKEVDKTLQIVQKLSQASQEVADKAHLAATLSSEMAKAAEGGGTAAHNAVDKINE
ncbi:MAG TPA: methyl-accepting chemotaxis protein, partial [Negativicutes bacterium]